MSKRIVPKRITGPTSVAAFNHPGSGFIFRH
jgi:hypothetical protein